MGISMATRALTLSIVMGLASVIAPDSVSPQDSASGPTAPAQGVILSPRIYNVTSYGADPTGQRDSVEAILQAITDAFRSPADSSMAELADRRGAQLNLEGGTYRVSRPLQLPVTGNHDYTIRGGTLRATADFPEDEFLVDLSAPASAYQNNYDYVTIRDLILDANSRGGGIQVANSRRTTIVNCYISGFTTSGILVEGGHEVSIRNSYLGRSARGEPADTTISWKAITLKSPERFLVQSIITGRA